MANNRLYLYCKSCGKAFGAIAKTMGNGWYASSDIKSDELNEFFDRHNKCNKHKANGMDEGYYDVIEENNGLVKKVGFRDENGDLEL